MCRGFCKPSSVKTQKQKNVIARFKTNYSMQECAVSSGGTVTVAECHGLVPQIVVHTRCLLCFDRVCDDTVL